MKIPWAQPDYWGKEQDYVQQALASSWISGGPFLDRLEREFAAFVDVPHAQAVANGTAAIHLAYLGLGIQSGDEIVVPGFAFQAAANIALHMGAKPLFAEVDPATWCVTAGAIEKCITARTKAIVAVHTYGNVCEMNEILALGKSRNIPVVEDAAESFASCYKGRQSGAMATIGTYSFQATKTITTGEGGMVVTSSKELHEKMALYRSHGMLRKRYWHEVAGHNFRLTNLQAALGCAQLEKIQEISAARRQMHSQYTQCLKDTPGVILQHISKNVAPVLWAMTVRLDAARFPQGRDAVMEQMLAAGIETRPGFYAPSLQSHLYQTDRLPISEEISHAVISLPSFPTLKAEQIEMICETLKNLRDRS
jgi:perosamine synthetase